MSLRTVFSTLAFLYIALQPLSAQWEVKHSNIDQQGSLRAIDFKDSQLGFAMGDHGALYRSDDAGESWTYTPVNLPVDIADFQFVGDSTMVAAGGEDVIVSSDLGATWTMVHTEAEEDFQELYFYNDSTAVLLGVAGIYRTVDQGRNWGLVWNIEEEGYLFGQALELASPADSLSFVSCIGLPEEEGSNIQNFVLKSTDTGSSWTMQSSVNNLFDLPYGLDFVSQDTGYLGSETGMLWGTTDQGESWDSLTTVPFPIFDLHYTSSTTAFATGSWLIGIPTFMPSGCVGRSTDGGLNWDTLITPRVPLYALYTAGDSTAFVVGQHDIIMKYNPEVDGIAGDYPTDTEEALPVTQLQLFPNPARSQEVFLRVETAANQQFQLLLLDVHGRRLQQRTIQLIPGENIVPLQLPSLASGTYFVQLRSGQAVRTLRLFVN
ncbi:MAG TPA: YCF48-related protein [Phaeodactylibacter sp.]|nr:YCF48-related protein [Phaeodactylibacter sp.]